MFDKRIEAEVREITKYVKQKIERSGNYEFWSLEISYWMKHNKFKWVLTFKIKNSDVVIIGEGSTIEKTIDSALSQIVKKGKI